MDIRDSIRQELKKNNAVLVAHYYVSGELQDLAEETGGIVSDSLEMARFGQNSDADMIIVAGVKFMARLLKSYLLKNKYLSLMIRLPAL